MNIALGQLIHSRVPTPIDQQNVIRMNRDTLDSRAVLDLSQPATITMPETNGRYMSLQIVSPNEEARIVTTPGEYRISEEEVGTRYAYIIIRTFVDASNPADIEAVNALQDQIGVEGGEGTLDIRNWNREQGQTLADVLLLLASTLTDTSNFVGEPEEIAPLYQLLEMAFGWGSLPEEHLVAIPVTPENNDGNTPHSLTVSDVPVDAFWSISLYNAEGLFEQNDRERYTVNDCTAEPNPDGSYTVNFGRCEDGRINCLPIMEGWNYVVRLYEPRQEILNGTWIFPLPEPSQ